MTRLVSLVLALGIGVGTACAGGSLSGSIGSQTPSQQKTIVIGLTVPIPGLGAFYISSAIGGVGPTTAIHSVGLTAPLGDRLYEPRLATRLPSLDDGSIQLFPDGTMQTTWRLRHDVVWHDGSPFTADDLVFGSQLVMDPEMGFRSPNISFMERVEAIDAYMIRVYWNQTYYDHLNLGPKELSPLPVHLLRDAYLAADKDRFRNDPYWNAEYVQLGPFRLVDFGHGQTVVFEAFDGYFLGRPKVDRVILRAIGDAGALYGHLLAAAVDVTPPRTITDDQVFQLKREWDRTGEGKIFPRMDSLDFIVIQHHPERVRLPELAADPRIRQGLFWGLDRQTLRETIYPGFETGADTFLSPTDPRGTVVGQPFARYRFDQPTALRTLEGAGWRRDATGRLVRANGEAAELQVRGTPARSAKIAIIADMWRQLGITTEEFFTPPALAQNREHNAHLPGVEWSARPTGESLFNILITRQIPTAANRYGGANRGSYSNARFDALTDRLYNSVLNNAEQAQILKEVGEIWAVDFPIFPLQYVVDFSAVRKGASDGTETGWDFERAHLWTTG